MTGRPTPRPFRDGPRLTIVAARFLTRLPLPEVRWTDGDLARALGAFPLVGAAVAALAAAAFAAATELLPGMPAAVVAVLVAVSTTGALHEDGLADAADGLWGGADPARRLAIMKDSRIGTYGAVALVLTLALRIALLSGVTPGTALRALLVGHVLGRASTLWVTAAADPVTHGTGGAVAGPVSVTVWVVHSLTVALTLAATLGRGRAVVVLAVAAVAVAGCVRVSTRLVGGYTGDILGATNQVVHIATLATVVALEVPT